MQRSDRHLFWRFLLGLALLMALPPQEAVAGRFGAPRAISKAIQTNVRQAMRPRFFIRSRHAQPMTVLSLDQSGKWLVSAGENKSAQVWNLETGQQAANFRLAGQEILAAAFPAGSTQVALAGSGGGFQLGNADSGQLGKPQGGKTLVRALLPGTAAHSLLTGDDQGQVTLWQNGRPQPLLKANAPITALALNGSLVAAGDEKGTIHLIKGNGETPLKGDSRVTALSFSPDGTQLLSAHDDGSLHLWQTANGQRVATLGAHEGKATGAALAQGKGISSGEDGSLRLWNLSGGESGRGEGHQGAINALVLPAHGRFGITAGADKTIRFWRLPDGAELARLVAMDQGWAVVSPDGYFDGTLDGKAEDRLDAVGWAIETGEYPLDGFLEGYFRPGLLGGLLGTPKLAQAAKVDPQQPKVAESFPPPPGTRILSPSGGQVGSTTEVTVEVTDMGGGIGTVRLFHNGRLISDRQMKQSQGKDSNGRAQETRSWTVAMASGKNRLRALALSQDRIEGPAAEISLVHTPPKPEKPDLHVVAVGINLYKNKQLDLNFGVPDAKGVLAHFSRLPKEKYGRLVEHTLYNGQATQANIYALLDKLEKTNPDDAVLIYMAGHGEAQGENWYFIPHDLTEPWEPAKLEKGGVSSLKLQLMIAKMGARKIFLLLDACKSGAAVGFFSETGDRRSFALLSRATGIHVASASTAEQYAGELEDLGHGLFTYVILEGLRGSADVEPKDGRITVSEVLSFIRSFMPKIIKKYQAPSQQPVINSRGDDFLVAAKK